MGFSVATNFDDGLLEAVAHYPVTEVFGKLPSDRVGGGRASFALPSVSRERFVRHVKKARAKGMGFNYLLNPACMDNREYSRRGQKDINELLAFIESAGVSAVTISLPFLLPVIKKRYPRLRVRVGVFARVDSVTKAKFWEDGGADSITLESLSANRDFELLTALRKAITIELRLIANANCRLFCPFSGQHMVNLSHASQRGHVSRGFMIDWCLLKCSYDKLKDPVQYLRSEFIRPEDIGMYREMGYDSFKILERGAPTSVLVNRVKAYSEERYDGNLLDLIQPYGYKGNSLSSSAVNLLTKWFYLYRPWKVRIPKLTKLNKLAGKRGILASLKGDPVYIDNSELKDFIPGFRVRDCRKTDCMICGWCPSYAKRAVKIDDTYRTELLKLYEESFNDLYSGDMWGLK